MRAREIHLAACQLNGGPLLWPSVKDALSAYSRGGDRRFLPSVSRLRLRSKPTAEDVCSRAVRSIGAGSTRQPGTSGTSATPVQEE